MKRTICIVTGTRAEYGLLYWLMKGIEQSLDLTLQVVATGAHLSPAHGLTYHQIETDGIAIDAKVDMQLSTDTPAAITKSVGHGMIGFADALDRLNPNIIVLLGDRYELIGAAYAALIARIPVAHIHGGETTEGAFDEAIRHSITKIAYLHFTGAEAYRRRVIQLGEHPDRVFNVGGMGVDVIRKTPLLPKAELEKSLGFKFRKRNLLITFHPVTLEDQSGEAQFGELLAALAPLKDTGLIFTAPNADTGALGIADMITAFVEGHPDRAIQFNTMGQQRYLSSLQFVDAVVGNSSSGLAEAPTFEIGTINIGDRQKGRLSASSVIDCPPERGAIRAALKKLYSTKFQDALPKTQNPYGDGNACERIIEVLRSADLPANPKKSFYDLA